METANSGNKLYEFITGIGVSRSWVDGDWRDMLRGSTEFKHSTNYNFIYLFIYFFN